MVCVVVLNCNRFVGNWIVFVSCMWWVWYWVVNWMRLRLILLGVRLIMYV